jgi:enterochelin esterase-like enzyme
MQKDDEGVWSLNVGPLVPDFYSYSFNVDGVRTIDPRNPMVKQGVASMDSMFLVPGPEAAFEDLLTGIIPQVESTYRVLTTRENRAIAGLSMGGAETLRTAPSNLDKFAWIGVFSMGLQEGVNAGVNSDFVQRNAAFFTDPEKTNKQVKLFWIGVGKDDRTVTDGPKKLLETLKAHNIRHEFHESEGGHTWINWRVYLRDFTQLLFR